VVERIVLGCGNFGGIGSAPEFFGKGESEQQAFALMDSAWELGVRWFDTADAYGGGRSETYVGRWMAKTGNRPRLTTKTYNPMRAGADHGLAHDRVLRQIESSLERLGVDSVEVYLAHAFDPETRLAETLSAFEELVERGLVHGYGFSNFDAAQLAAALQLGRPGCVQNSYSLLERGDEHQLLPLCGEHGVAYQAFSPLAGGWLTGKYGRDQAPPPGSRMTMRPEPYRHFDDPRVYDSLDALAEEAAGRGVSMGALALAWALAHPSVASIVIGPRRPDHFEAVREALDLSLSDADRARLSSLFPP
jgi:1-deoxyxylulose-5-phosphate synthase